jgi:hypothetical protein
MLARIDVCDAKGAITIRSVFAPLINRLVFSDYC